MPWLGLLLGAVVGASFAGFRGAVLGAAIGFIAGELLRKWRGPTSALTEAPLFARLAAIEKRLAHLEAKQDAEGSPTTALESSPISTSTMASASTAPSEAAEVSPALSKPTAQGDALSMPATLPLPVRKGGAGSPASAGASPVTVTPTGAGSLNPIWAWFTGGNAIVRVGIVVLFFGVAFLLSYFAENFTLPVEAKFAAVALIGAAMIAVGARLRVRRRAYAMSMIGGGLGVLYLTVFAALQLVPLLAPPVAFALLAAIAALAAILALRFDAQALAALAAFGGLLAPTLVKSDGGVALLFGYVALVNATVLAIAWRRSWYALNLVGFVFTFLLALWWGFEFYKPEYFASVEPFLILYFVAYLAVPVANGLFAQAIADRRLDALLVFGVPMVAFALQATLVQVTAYGLAWSAAAMALIYALLWLALRRRNTPMIASLSASHAALAIVFATLVVPLAVDPHWTSAIWAIEAVAVYWNACRQESRFGRAFALLLQLATGAMFILGGWSDYPGTAFANRQFLAIAAIALSAFATTRFADAKGDQLPDNERALVPLIFAWACAWWLIGGALEAGQHVAPRYEAHAMLAWVVVSIAAAASMGRLLRWPRLDTAALVLLPAIALGLSYDIWRRRTGMPLLGWALYPVAWALQFAMLYRAEGPRAESAATSPVLAQRKEWLSGAHAVSVLLLLGQIAWEAGEWTARVTPRGTAWAACAHLLPLAAFLFAIRFATRSQSWPLTTFPEAYRAIAGMLVALVLGAGFAALAILHPGDASPLPYVPLLNPLEVTLGISLAAIIAWGRLQNRSIHAWLAAGAFLVLNGAVARTVHHWLDVPWRFSALVSSKTLEAALTLTWSACAVALMVTANRRSMRAVWFAGAGLLAAAVVKLFVVDLAALAGLTRVVAFLGVGALLLLIGYMAPLPPAVGARAGEDLEDGERRHVSEI